MAGAQVSYQALSAPRFRIEPAPEGGERIVIPAVRRPLMMAFMAVWLCGWTVGGFMAMTTMRSHFQLFLAFWLCGWALGELWVLTILAWSFGGRETLRLAGGDLEISAELFGFARRRLYRASQIRRLAAGRYVEYSNGRMRMEIPLLMGAGSGVVQFSYGARTIYAGVALDEAEGRLIVERLVKGLPKTAIRAD